MNIPNILGVEFKHILRCKDKSCFFCENIYRKTYGEKQFIETKKKETKKRKLNYGWNEELDQKIRYMREQGLSYQSISEKIGKSKIAVLLRIKKKYPELMGRIKKE